MKRISVLFAAQNLYIGGVQQSLVNLIKTMTNQGGYDIDLFVFGRGSLLEQIPEEVNIIYGKKSLALAATPFAEVKNSKSSLDFLLRLFLMIEVRLMGSERFYRHMFEKYRFNKVYDKAISYFTDVPRNYFNQGTNLFISDFVSAKEKVTWIHTDPILSGFDREYCKNIYKHFDKIVCVSKAVKEKFDLILPEYAYKTEVIYNKFITEEIKEKSEAFDPAVDKSVYNIVTVCRVDNVSKRIDKIIDICKRLKDDGITDFCWRIVGGGPDLKADMKKAEECGVGKFIIFEGEKTDPYPYIRVSDLFALYSAYEGYPMVVGEAIILNVPILTTEYAAAHEQIPPSKGYIAKNDDDFYEKLKECILIR